MERGISVHALAEALSMSTSSFYRRLGAPESLTIAEVQTIRRTLSLNFSEANEIFFDQQSHDMRLDTAGPSGGLIEQALDQLEEE